MLSLTDSVIIEWIFRNEHSSFNHSKDLNACRAVCRPRASNTCRPKPAHKIRRRGGLNMRARQLEPELLCPEI